jgi:hypothetical protein
VNTLPAFLTANQTNRLEQLLARRERLINLATGYYAAGKTAQYERVLLSICDLGWLIEKELA